MTNSRLNDINIALETLLLPPFITKNDIKKQYHFLAKKNHPDIGGDSKKMKELNDAYLVLTKYIDDFRYTFDNCEIKKQFGGTNI